MRKLAGERASLNQQLLDDQKAARNKILSAILALDGYAGFKFERYASDKENIVTVTLLGAEAWIIFHHTEGFSINLGDKSERRVPLLWNVISKDFEGTTVDAYRSPVPGEPPRMRTAVASILCALLAHFPAARGRF